MLKLGISFLVFTDFSVYFHKMLRHQHHAMQNQLRDHNRLISNQFLYYIYFDKTIFI